MILDCFAGPGGWSEGLRMLGLQDVGLELDADACATRRAAGHPTIRADVARYPLEPFVGRAWGLIASPPCTAFSMAGKGKGRDEIAHLHDAVEACRGGWVDPGREWADPTSVLVLEPLRWAWELRDSLEWIACEQVPPVLDLWRHMADVLRSWGFDATAVKLDSEQYGVPQTRTRAFLLAHRERVTVPKPTHQRYVKGVAAGAAAECQPSLFGPGLLPWVSMAEALGWGDAVRTNLVDRMNGGKATRYEREAGAPAPTVNTRSDLWERTTGELNTGRDWQKGEGRESAQRIPLDQPAPTIGGTNLRAWHLNQGATESQPNRRLYSLDEPAPSIGFGHDRANWRWELKAGTNENDVARTEDEPAPTVRFGDRLNKVEWTKERPATTIVGAWSPEMVTPPGHRDMGPGDPSRQDAEGAVRIRIEEAAVLQSFPPDYPWQGSKTSQFSQVGNAVPPRLAAHVLRALITGEA